MLLKTPEEHYDSNLFTVDYYSVEQLVEGIQRSERHLS